MDGEKTSKVFLETFENVKEEVKQNQSSVEFGKILEKTYEDYLNNLQIAVNSKTICDCSLKTKIFEFYYFSK